MFVKLLVSYCIFTLPAAYLLIPGYQEVTSKLFYLLKWIYLHIFSWLANFKLTVYDTDTMPLFVVPHYKVFKISEVLVWLCSFYCLDDSHTETDLSLKPSSDSYVFIFRKALGTLWHFRKCRSPECLVFMAHDTSNILYIGFNIFERPFWYSKKTPVPQYPFYVWIKLVPKVQSTENVQKQVCAAFICDLC